MHTFAIIGALESKPFWLPATACRSSHTPSPYCAPQVMALSTYPKPPSTNGAASACRRASKLLLGSGVDSGKGQGESGKRSAEASGDGLGYCFKQNTGMQPASASGAAIPEPALFNCPDVMMLWLPQTAVGTAEEATRANAVFRAGLTHG